MSKSMTQAADQAAAKAQELEPAIEQASALDVTPASTDSQADALMAAVQQAVAAGKDADTVERLLNMSERIMDRKANEQFWSAFHQARSEMPAIKARARNQQTNSNYALLEDITDAIEPIYSKHGFSMNFWARTEGELRRVFCKLSHIGGHSEEFDTDLPFDSTGIKGTQNKTGVHAAGSTDSYGQRYLTVQVWNLKIVKNPYDDDGNAGGAVELIDDEQVANIAALFEEVGGDKSKFLQPYGCEDFDTMPKKFFARAIARLEKKRKAGEQ